MAVCRVIEMKERKKMALYMVEDGKRRESCS